jgi:hypothetical protein
VNALILYPSEDGQAQVQLRADRDTVWLTQLDMAELFQTPKQNIAKHLKTIFSEEELREDSVVNQWLTTQTGSGLAASNHFRSVTQMVVRGKGSMHEVNDEATQ